MDHVWIPLNDGTRLAARLWLPDTPEPVPALLEYLPYRKGDAFAARDNRHHAYFARPGGGGRRLAEDLARPARRAGADDRAVAVTPAPRRILAAWERRRGLRRHTGRGVRGGRLGGRLQQRGAAADRRADRAAQGAD